MVTRFFWNDDQRRLRAPWRLALQVALIVGLAVGVNLLFNSLFPLLRSALESAPDSLLPAVVRAVGGVLTGAVFVGAIWLGNYVLDRRRFPDYGFHLGRDWWLDLGFGLVLGAALMTLVFLVELAAGWVTVTGTVQTAVPGRSFAAEFLATFVFFVSVGVYEELLLRGYLLRNLAEGLQWFDRVRPVAAIVAATVVSSLVFGVLHFFNPNATLVSTLGISFAGVFLAIGYVLTGELAIPVGVHVTWNFFQGPVFGFPVSGSQSAATLVAVEQHGPRVVTGGPFGPEAGLVGLGAILVGSVAITAWVRRRYGDVTLQERLVTPVLRWRA
ncbi:CPBP family intramembrane glutamic endopeptidase [Halobacteriaceae archaeon GCM10025711]